MALQTEKTDSVSIPQPVIPWEILYIIVRHCDFETLRSSAFTSKRWFAQAKKLVQPVLHISVTTMNDDHMKVSSKLPVEVGIHCWCSPSGLDRTMSVESNKGRCSGSRSNKVGLHSVDYRAKILSNGEWVVYFAGDEKSRESGEGLVSRCVRVYKIGHCTKCGKIKEVSVQSNSGGGQVFCCNSWARFGTPVIKRVWVKRFTQSPDFNLDDETFCTQ
eukprot:TRINITY_DN16067_c0_g1_i1.p1 TRINITY_DN16067_c0_g1~~TRINITY_DN16067_c0_g1_i1.p1  ORF type:complete len:229 (+),score=12.56 TRINITY_DN16067_c0_g1_i1:37-687(+)